MEHQFSIDDLAPRKRPIADVHGLSRLGDPPTSHAAAQSISGRTERLIVAVFKKSHPWDFTADELCHELPNVEVDTLKSALSRVLRSGAIEPTGTTRLSNRGRAMTVYRLAPVSSPGSREEQ